MCIPTLPQPCLGRLETIGYAALVSIPSVILVVLPHRVLLQEPVRPLSMAWLVRMLLGQMVALAVILVLAHWVVLVGHPVAMVV
jgi:hypothetical protein